MKKNRQAECVTERRKCSETERLRLDDSLTDQVDMIYGAFLEFIKDSRIEFDEFFCQFPDPPVAVAMWHRAADVYGHLAESLSSREERCGYFLALATTANAATDLIIALAPKTNLAPEKISDLLATFFSSD